MWDSPFEGEGGGKTESPAFFSPAPGGRELEGGGKKMQSSPFEGEGRKRKGIIRENSFPLN